MGCGPDAEPGLRLEGSLSDAGPMEIEEVAAVGRDDGLIFGQPTSIAVGADGRVFVADVKRAFVWVLSPEGDSLGTIGRRGQGPGEFRMPARVTVGPNDSLFVYDMLQDRISVFPPGSGRSFAYSFQLPRNQNRRLSKVFPGASGRLLSLYGRPQNPNLDQSGTWIVHANRSGHILDDSLTFLPAAELIVRNPAPGQVVSVGRPYGRKPIYTQHPTGDVCFAWTDSLHVKCLSVEAPTPATVLDIDHEPVPITDADRDQAEAALESDQVRMVREEGWHDTHPAFTAMTIDRESRFWIREAPRTASFREKAYAWSGTSTWHVINVEENTFHTVTLPAGYEIQEATDTYVYQLLRPEPAIRIFRMHE